MTVTLIKNPLSSLSWLVDLRDMGSQIQVCLQYLHVQSNLVISNSLIRITAYLEVKIWSLF